MDNSNLDLESAGRRMHELIAELYPIHRSIAGPGVRKTLEKIKTQVPIQIFEVPTGTRVFDWTVPQEWNCRDAYIKDDTGTRIVDIHNSNLHVVNFSIPFHAKMFWQELKSHLHFLEEHPDWIPYRTSYFERNWGFCLSLRQFLELETRGNREYEVCIDAEIKNGSLSYGELFLPGKIDEEVLISCHICHPSLANDNLSGIAVATYLADILSGVDRYLSYRFIFIPATIGAVTWICRNESHMTFIKHGLVLAGLGDAGRITYKKSRSGADIDRAVAHVLHHSGEDHEIVEFSPSGYDERQFCSPGFNLPVGCLMRTPTASYTQYHTSADDLNFVQPRYLADSLAKTMAVMKVLDQNRVYRNLQPKCEPQLGKHGLYQSYGKKATGFNQLAVQWVLNFSDGQHSLLDIAERSGLLFETIKTAADRLHQTKLLKESPQ